MSYHISLIREENGTKKPIGKEEIVNYVSSNSVFSYEDKGTYLNIKKIITEGEAVYFIYQDGELFVKNPTDVQLEEFILLAEVLGGRVRGENFETYRSNEETYVHPNDASEASQLVEQIRHNKSKRKINAVLWKVGFIVGGLILGIVIGFARK